MTWEGYVVGIVGVLITAIGGLLVAGRNAKASPYQAMADHMVWATERIKALEAERGEDRDRIEALESEVRRPATTSPSSPTTSNVSCSGSTLAPSRHRS